jgi:hypothetical protein
MHTAKIDLDAACAEGEDERNPCFLDHAELRPYMRLSDCSQARACAAAPAAGVARC